MTRMKKKVIPFLAVGIAVTALALFSYGAYAALIRQTVTVDAGVTVNLVGAKVSPIAPAKALQHPEDESQCSALRERRCRARVAIANRRQAPQLLRQVFKFVPVRL